MKIEKKEEQLFMLVSQTLKVDKSELDLDTNITEMRHWDSMTHMVLIVAIEDHFGFQFTNDQIAELSTLRGIAAAVEKNS
jgi:acyl carrier protein